MARNQDGEFELLVGNKQLLSVVFIIIILFGVVFSLGYFVGRNTAPDASAASPAATKTPLADTASTHTETGDQAAAQPAESPFGGLPNEKLGPGEAELSSGTQPVANTSSQTPASNPTPPAQTNPTAEARTHAVPAPTPKPVAQEPQTAVPMPGQVFLQVAAVKRPEAELVVDVLRKKGFRALVAPVTVNGQPSTSLFRALVGPFKDASSLAKAKSDLESAGFKPIKRQY